EIDCSKYAFPALFTFAGADADFSIVHGLVINRMAGNTFRVSDSASSSYMWISGNFLGTDPTGSQFLGGPGDVIALNNTYLTVIGGSDPADSNVIVGGAANASTALINVGAGAGYVYL